MPISFHGRLEGGRQVRAGFIGCGSHSFRNIYPTFQFAPVELVATCDLDAERAAAFARQFGARSSYADHREMLAREELEAVFIVTGYDEAGRPMYPALTVDCLEAGSHVWMEKPPAASCAEVERMQEAAEAAGKTCLVGFKTMFFPANEKARELMDREEFGRPSLLTIRRPVHVPEKDEIEAYVRDRKPSQSVTGFLDHICHPASLLLYLAGMPETLYYERSPTGAALATFRFASGAVASLALTHGASYEGGIEQTFIAGEGGRHILVDNNVRVSYHRGPARPEGWGYGNTPTHFTGAPETTTACWEPEFSLGQLYNKGLFLQGFWGEVDEFARAVLEDRQPAKGHLEHAWQATRVFEAFAEGPGRVIEL
jgi:predicted dehydrogenase